LEGQIGFYVNTLALRNQFSKEDSITTLYQKIKENTLGAYTRQVYPYDELVDALKLTRDMSRNPLFDVMLSYLNKDEARVELNLKGSSVNPFHFSSEENISAKFDLDITFQENGDEILFGLIYNSDVYSEIQMNQLSNSFIKILEEIPLNQNVSISEIGVLTPNEIDKFTSYLQVNLNEIHFESILESFYEQVNIHPDQTAIVFKDIELSFLELDRLSNKLARYLRDRFLLQKGDFLIIELDKSQYTVITVLSALKLGVVFVPLDSNYPEDRKRFILSDNGCENIVDSVIIKDFLKRESSLSDDRINVPIYKNDLIYCIYTSGSTGQPKGVLVEHCGVINMMEDWKAEYKITANDCLLQIASFSFDVFMGDLCRSIFIGTKLVICPDEIKFSSDEIIHIIQSYKISILEATPAFMIPLIDEIMHRKVKLKSLRCMIFGSDTIDFKTFKKYSKEFSDLLLINSFGTTETTIDNSYYVLSDGDNEEKSTPIGKPFKNNYFLLMNRNMQLVPYGSVGEICIGGVGLARGYLNRPELTKEKFITNPYNPSERLYRTGDLGRWREDGNLEYLGRIDDQVKIRGYRIELGEIEQALSSYPNCKQAVVIARTLSSKSTDKELIAYSTGEATAEELKAYLKEKLPSYMVPSYYVKLQHIPLTSNGKVDRKNLPDPEGTGLQNAEYLAPRTATEKQLVKLWSEVLGVEECTLSIKADFFDLGGNSLNAIRLITRIHRSLEVRLMISDLFLHTELELMARLIESLNASNEVKSNFEIEL
jgi:amino acid adenylation domain-containing protein